MRVSFQSRTLASALYDPVRHQLELQFCSGKRYLYFRVPPQSYAELLQADSKGAFFNRAIRNRFPFQELSAIAAPIVLVSSKTK
jgi:hypothetical protein